MLGYSLLLSDVDILSLKNPFDHLYRDEDVEALSDGFDPPTAYGEPRWGAGGARTALPSPRPGPPLSPHATHNPHPHTRHPCRLRRCV